MVKLTDITVRRRCRVILGPITMDLSAQGVIQCVGRNGSGKSTLLRVLHGLETPRYGHIDWGGPVDRALESFLFQTPTMLRRTVQANLELPLRLRGLDLGPVADMADRFDLGPYLKQPAHLLSGGELQRVALARALITQPKRIFMDEPTANLDRATTTLVEQVISELVAQGVHVMLSTHSVRQLGRIGGTVVFLDDGQITGSVPVADFLENPPTQAARDWVIGD